MKKFTFTLLVLLSTLKIFSQGFDWELSPRLYEPFSPYFIGINYSLNISKDLGNFNFYEDKCNCGKFDNGNGVSQKIGINFEKWTSDGTSSLNIGIFYTKDNNYFSVKQSLPIITPSGEESLIIYENSFDNLNHDIVASFEFKKRLLESFYFLSFGTELLFTFENNQKHYEKIISPANANPFPTIPPSKKRLIESGHINNLRKYNFTIFLSFGKDIDLGFKYYLSPYMNISYTFLNQIYDDKWKSISGGIGLKIMRWLY